MDKECAAIERLRLAAEMSETYYEQPLIITTSGGKDSDVCLHLAQAAGINYEVHHNHTTADAPETVRHVRETFRKLEEKGIKCTINWPTYKGAYIRAFDRMIEERKARGLATEWQTGIDAFNWWMEYDVLPGQMDFHEVMNNG